MTTAFINSSSLSDWQKTLTRPDRDIESACDAMVARIAAALDANPDRIALREFVALLEDVGQNCRSSSVAWAAGQAVQLKYDSELGRAILGCKSLGSGLHWMCQYFPLLQDASCLRLDVEEDRTTLSYKILDPTIWPRHEDAMYTLGIYSALIRAAAPDAWSHVQIAVEAEPEDVKADLAGIVQAPVVYGANANSIRFPTSIINAPLNLAPPCQSSLIKKLSADLTRKKRLTPITERTRQMIFNEMNEGRVNQEHIARQLGISSRTLRRRLSEENQSFQALLDECRMQFAALEFRTRKKLSLSDMALKLGYSEHSTFSRAFARWAGMAPQEYRRSVAAH